MVPTPPGDTYVPAERATIPQECFPLGLFLCESCGCIQLLDVVDPAVIYAEYIYQTSISLGLPENTQLSFVDKLFKGMLDISRKYKVNIVGGDLSRSSKVVIDVSMLGVVKKRQLTLRNGARAGDIIFITGSLGSSILGKHLKFSPRVKEAGFLARNFKVNAMTDISDGLTQDLGHIIEQSRVGAIIYADLIPLSKQAVNLSDALNSGEEFELLFTLTRLQAKKLLKLKRVDFKPIGEITEKKYGFKLINKNNRAVDIRPRGFRHF